MSKPSAMLVPALVALPLALGLAPQERLLKDTDLKKVGEAIAEYIEARAENKGIGEAETAVQEAMDKLERKLSKTPAEGDLLASPSDVGQAIWLSFDYARQRVRGGKVEEASYTEGYFTKDSPLEYAIWAPSKYSAKDGPYPLVITIPDEGVRPTDHLIERWSDGDIRENVILAAPVMPSERSQWTERDGVARVIVLMRAIYESYAVDFDRIYLAGRGLGVSAAVAIAEQFPDRFAGVIGRTGDAGETAPDNFRNLPTYFAGGGSQVTAFEDAVRRLGYENCTVDAEGKEPEIWSWMQAQRRQSYPAEVVLVPGSPFPVRAYWLEVPPSDGSDASRISAKVDRATNTITVEGQGMTEFALYFNDLLVDMNRPVKVVANGAEHTDELPRSAKFLLERIFNGFCDPGRVFVYSKTYSLPAVSKEGQ